jgi:hypothetical protein
MVMASNRSDVWRHRSIRKTANEMNDPIRKILDNSWLAGPLIFAAIIIFALSLLQWKDVADGRPEVTGRYIAIDRDDNFPRIWTFGVDFSEHFWKRQKIAYIPVPIPEYVKEQR